MDSRAYSRLTPSAFTPDSIVKKLLLPFGLAFFFFGLIMFARYMQYREENTRRVCVMPPFPVGICGDVVASPGDRLLLDEIVNLPETGPVVHNYWARINGQSVPVEVMDDGHNGVNLYATVPDSQSNSFGRSALTPAQQLFQSCINVGGTLYGLDKDGDGYYPELTNNQGDLNNYPCVVSGYLPPPYVMLASPDLPGLIDPSRIEGERGDLSDANSDIH